MCEDVRMEHLPYPLSGGGVVLCCSDIGILMPIMEIVGSGGPHFSVHHALDG